MAKINAKLGTNYDLFNYYGAPDADRVIVAMGSICDVADEVIDYLNARGEKVGIIKVRLYRPWVSASLLKVLPKTAKKVAVLDRTKEPGSLGEPLYPIRNGGRLNYFSGRAKVNLRWIVIKSDPVRESKGIG